MGRRSQAKRAPRAHGLLGPAVALYPRRSRRLELQALASVSYASSSALRPRFDGWLVRYTLSSPRPSTVAEGSPKRFLRLWHFGGLFLAESNGIVESWRRWPLHDDRSPWLRQLQLGQVHDGRRKGRQTMLPRVAATHQCQSMPETTLELGSRDVMAASLIEANVNTERLAILEASSAPKPLEIDPSTKIPWSSVPWSSTSTAHRSLS